MDDVNGLEIVEIEIYRKDAIIQKRKGKKKDTRHLCSSTFRVYHEKF